MSENPSFNRHICYSKTGLKKILFSHSDGKTNCETAKSETEGEFDRGQYSSV
jgi:hypothetical protein